MTLTHTCWVWGALVKIFSEDVPSGSKNSFDDAAVEKTARCANGDLACGSGVGAQQNPSLTPAQQAAVGKYFGDTSTQYQRASAMAAASGNVAVASSFEIAAGVAGLLEQAFTPSAGKVLVDNALDVAAQKIADRLRIPLPVVVEVVEREIKPRLQGMRDFFDGKTGATP